VLGLLKTAVKEFGDDDCPRMAAALSYYTVFSLPPLLILLIMLAGLIWDPRDVQGAIETQIASLIGNDGAQQIREILAHADRPGSGGAVATALGLGALLFGATGAFIQLQGALNQAWEVEPDPAVGGIRNFITKRVFSFGMILGIAFLLLVSLALTAAVSAMWGMVGGGLPEEALHVTDMVISFAVVALLFAAMFKVMPDAIVAWRDVLVGGVLTALLFTIGKWALGFYLGQSDPGSAFGAAGSLALILVWIYYASMILLFGAEMTQAWAERRGAGIRPEKGAVRVVERKRRLRGPEAERAARQTKAEEKREEEGAPPAAERQRRAGR
jgi:membrane protein